MALDSASGQREFRHRNDIDGLRALAIVPILFLHCGIPGFRGGFVGVDIFFVISGYLITGILTREIESGNFTLLAFYRRRIVRILPALWVMMATTMAVGCVLLLPNPLRDLGNSVVAASLFVSNGYFYATSDYFAAGSDAKPLIHTWSLAVEEQFYLLYPLLLMALRHRLRDRLAMALMLLSGASLVVGGVLAWFDPSAGFFLLPSRIWELALGGLVAIGATPRLTHPLTRALAAMLGMAIIIVSCVVTNSGWPFPVPFALPPALGAALLIAYGEQTPTARLLGWRPVRAIGLISYSLYLWHRPIIAYYQLEHGSTLSPGDSVLLLSACLAAATASYWLVERPVLRRWRQGSGTMAHKLALGILALSASLGAVVAAQADTIQPLSPALARIASYMGHDSSPAGHAQFSTDRCFTLPTGRPYDRAMCLAPAKDRPNLLLMGDSHAAQLSQAFRQQFPNQHIMQATAAGCRPLLHGGGNFGCRRIVAQGYAIARTGQVQTVVLAGRWLDFEVPALLESVRFLRSAGVNVVVIGPMVEYDADEPALLVFATQRGDAALPQRFLLRDRLALDGRLAPQVRAAGARYLSARDLECPGGRCQPQMPDGTPRHFDHSHLTPPAARALVSALAHPAEASAQP